MRNILALALALFLVSTGVVHANQNIEYVLQVLEPSGGKIMRPANWHYQERHNSLSSLYWIISKENNEHGGYETGMAIQFMIGAQKSSGLPLKDMMQKTLEHTAKSAKEISRCEPESAGFFTRQCLEVEEIQSREGSDVIFHVQYSFFWNEEMDMAAVAIAGAPVELWNENKEIFKRMSEVDLVDLSRFKNK